VKRLVVLAAALALAAPAAGAVPQVHGRAYLVQNAYTNEVLASWNAKRRVPIASLTKLMTVLLTLEHAKPRAVVTVAPGAASVGESSIDLYAGERITVRELLEGALIQSANDAADALAYYLGKGSMTRFVADMNARAKQLRLADTHFVRPDGLDATGHYSSARDITALARAVMAHRLARDIVRRRTATLANGEVLHTWNDLLGTFPGVFGVKTGHTSAAGWNEVAGVARNGVVLYATLLGSPDRGTRNADLAALLRWGLSRYKRAAVIQSDRVYAKVDLGYGKGKVGLVAPAPVWKGIRVDRPLVQRVVARTSTPLPVLRGQPLGRIVVWQDKRPIASTALVAERTVKRPGALGRVGFYAGRTVSHVWGWVH
jgi:serine-type D-Ala-D-Ala carboxypeptidase (penicillin-binding protein 5/6)